MIEFRDEFLRYIDSLTRSRDSRPLKEKTKQFYRSLVKRIEQNLPRPLNTDTSEDDVCTLSFQVQKAGFKPSQLENIGCIIRHYLKFLRLEGGVLQAQESAEEAGEYTPLDPVSARKKVKRSIALRRGQRKFRNALLKAYDGKCCITGTSFTPVLEAAHILAYVKEGTNEISNGLLLRSDLHVLFDLCLLSVNPSTLEVRCSPKLRASPAYKGLHGQRVILPQDKKQWPSRNALRLHYDQFCSVST